ncbi:hypothetical protein [Nostoc sp.]
MSDWRRLRRLVRAASPLGRSTWRATSSRLVQDISNEGILS